MKLHQLTPHAVLAAMDEFVRLGRAAFLTKYGFGRARDYFVRHPTAGFDCDSKAIAGAAYGHQWPAEGPLSAKDFSGRDATVARVLTRLGFEMVGAGGEWSELEVELIVVDYLNRLTLELTGQSDNQSTRFRSLKQRLPGKSGNVIAYEQARISAVLSDLGFPHLRMRRAGAPLSARPPNQRSRRNADAFSSAGRSGSVGCRATGTSARVNGLLDHQGRGTGQTAPRRRARTPIVYCKPNPPRLLGARSPQPLAGRSR